MNTSFAQRTTALFIVLGALAGCGGETTAPDMDKDKDPGTVEITLRRLNNSQIPPEADSAFVRVWNTASSFNEVRAVKLPSPGTTANVSFSIPAHAGYSVGVIAYTRVGQGNNYELFAGGMTENITVVAGQANNASVTVVPWEVEFGGDDTLWSGTAATITARIKGGPTFLPFTFAAWGSGLTTALELPMQSASVSGVTTSYTFTAPTVATDTAMYFQADFDLLLSDAAQWIPPNRNMGATLVIHTPSPNRGQNPIRRLLLAHQPMGDLIISFDKRRNA